ncbi:hypothetical protein P7H63_13825, partial [Enterococcus lactis]|uniref:hypothetical protein n=1 Tax=Enterococcus lactis TaxID=357441 RepID=UPI0028904E2D
SFLLLSFSIILPYLIVDLKLCNRTLFIIVPAFLFEIFFSGTFICRQQWFNSKSERRKLF